MRSKYIQLILALIYIPSVFYALYLNLISGGYDVDQMNSLGRYTQIPLALLGALGGVAGIYISSHWGGFKSVIGKAMTFLSLGLLAWSGGMMYWLYHIFISGSDTVPYPSPGDFIFMWSQPMWSLGSYYLAQVVGAQYGLRTSRGKHLLAIAISASITVSYFLLFMVARGATFALSETVGKIFFDFYYPIGTTVSLATIAVVFLLSHKYLGGRYKSAVYMLLGGFVCQYFGDFFYTYSTNNETYFNGHWTDMFFMSSMFLISLAISKIMPDA